MPLGTVVKVLADHLTGLGTPAGTMDDQIVWSLRLPRVLLAAAVGAGLAVVGTTLRATVRNPLADPSVLGVSAGAGPCRRSPSGGRGRRRGEDGGRTSRVRKDPSGREPATGRNASSAANIMRNEGRLGSGPAKGGDPSWQTAGREPGRRRGRDRAGRGRRWPVRAWPVSWCWR
ncbi:iron ABC transporter permease [Streptomyces lichenis]|uniref:Iron ABC transporter permease n=1 Tax=Streptomyces lichenis TaxID=2306967 RepID=A0ABT0I455_9ACTN|nr:iron ABC transporter permease [Streptomyces lichenis]